MDAHGEALAERFLLDRTLGGASDALARVSSAWRMLAAIDASSSVGLRVVFPALDCRTLFSVEVFNPITKSWMQSMPMQRGRCMAAALRISS
jgi:hypothetical protein